MSEETTISRRFHWVGAAFTAFSLLLTLLPFRFSAQAITVDGLLKEKMWMELEPFTVIQLRDQPNCSIDMATIFVCFDEPNLITCIGCRFSHKKPSAQEPEAGETAEQPQVLSGIAVKVEDTDFLVFNTQNALVFNGDDYHIQGAVSSLSDTNTTAEILIGQKYGFRDPLSIQLRFYDADGIPSNVYALSIPSPTPPTTTAALVRNDIVTTAATTKPVKTTASGTKKEEKSAEQRTATEKTAVEKTTAEKTTKEKTTKEKTTKVKTTKAPKTTKPKTTRAKTTRTTNAPQELPDNNELLQEVIDEQAKIRNALYIGAGVLIVAAFVVCSHMIKRKDE